MTTSHAREFQLNSPGRLIAALPAVLGFVPEQSLVLVMLEGGTLSAVMRTDLCDDVLDAVEEIASATGGGRPDAAIGVIVDEAGSACRMCDDEHRQLADDMLDSLAGHGIELLAVHVVDRVAMGGRWRCADGCGSSGTVDDPSSSPLAAAAVLDGRRLFARRRELIALLAVSDPERTARLEPVIESMAHPEGQRSDAAARRDVEHAVAAAREFAAGVELSDERIARLACALTDPRVRDTLYALAVGASGPAAEALWAALARVLPARWRAEALVLHAFSAFVRGDGPLTGVSLDAALRCAPGHRMAGMLDHALRSGMRPEQIRELARTGYRLANRIGVALPPRRVFGSS
jgi:hypothetical protein